MEKQHVNESFKMTLMFVALPSKSFGKWKSEGSESWTVFKADESIYNEL